jgi:glycerol kinase
MSPSYIASIDQGTTSTRCIIFSQDGNIVQQVQKEHRQIYPRPGWVEHDPTEIWERVQDVAHAAVHISSLDKGEIAAIGITNQRETTVVWDKRTGKPYYNAIVWQDTRTKDQCDLLAQDGGQDRFRPKVGLPLNPYFSATKIKWILDNVDGVRQDAQEGNALFGNIDSWIIWNLTGGVRGGSHVTDVTNASRTMLMDLETLSWDEEILSILDIPISMLPRIVPSSDPNTWGKTEPNGCFGESIAVCGDLGDQQAALVGQTCFSVGEAKNTYGTGCFLLLNTGTTIVQSNYGLLTTAAYKFADQPAVYALEGSAAITGALIQWLRDNLGIIERSADVEDLAKTVDNNGGIYIVPAFSGLFAPYWRSDARGLIIGLTRYIHKGHIARAALEATAYQTREILEAMHKDSGVDLKSLKVDGGMVQNEILMQFQADILGVPVVRPKITETTALGAAYAAGLAIGFWQDTDTLKEKWQEDRLWSANMLDDERERLYSGWLKAVQRTLNWLD